MKLHFFKANTEIPFDFFFSGKMLNYYTKIFKFFTEQHRNKVTECITKSKQST